MKENPIIHSELQLCVRVHETEVTLLMGGLVTYAVLLSPAGCLGSDPDADAACIQCHSPVPGLCLEPLRWVRGVCLSV